MRRVIALAGCSVLLSAATIFAVTNPSILSVISVSGDCCVAGGLLPVSDFFYGRTFAGSGSFPYGSIFKTSLGGGLETMHAFTGNAASDGAYPNALIQGSDGLVHGTTFGGGGSSGLGTVFTMDAAGTVTTLHRFSGPDGDRPRAGLMQASDGFFYGTTDLGGNNGHGTLFRMDTAGNFSTVHHFTGVAGRRPFATLTETSTGALYGTTFEGGTSSRGTVFRLEADDSITTIHSFTGPDGQGPYGLIQGADGLLYGVTRFGGAGGHGTVFSTTLAGAVTTLHSFTGLDGREPVERLLQASDGRFYGIALTGGGKKMHGTAFRVDSAGSFLLLHRFSIASGHWVPSGPLVETADHRLLGTEQAGNTVYALTVVDLDVTDIDSSSSVVAPGGTVEATDTVVNQELATAGTSTTRYYFSLDAIKSTDDRRLAGGRSVVALAGGASSSGPATLKVPAGMPLGTYYLLACADDLFRVGETSETNNCEASGSTILVGLPDLVTTAVGAPPSVAIGQRMTVTDTVVNQGEAPARTSTSRYYLSFDTVRDASDALLTGTRSVPVLAPGVASAGSRVVRVPGGTAAGAYFVLACADDTSVTVETDDSNNCRASDSTVAVGP